MKALLVLLAIVAGVWLWRRGRRVSAAAQAPRNPVSDPQPMLRCACCGVHLPAGNAITGSTGRAYCCPAHQRQGESG
jgi:uncharacterized protein